MIKKFSKKIKNRQKTRTTAQNRKQKPHYSIQMMFNTFPFGRWPVAFLCPFCSNEKQWFKG